jgi:tRNA pseudouridine38-40 synthase
LARYFIEIAYKGTNFNGLAIQTEGKTITIQGCINQVLHTLLNPSITSTTSSRTDAGVHAHQNFLHFDYDGQIVDSFLYKANAILPQDISVKALHQVAVDKHSRFDANYRKYEYHFHKNKNPFLNETSYFFPHELDHQAMQTAAKILLKYKDFTSFSKKHSDAKTNLCELRESNWTFNNDGTFHYNVCSNRFLRGMVRALVGTMIWVGNGRLSVEKFEALIINKDATKANFSMPGHGLSLLEVHYDYI